MLELLRDGCFVLLKGEHSFSSVLLLTCCVGMLLELLVVGGDAWVSQAQEGCNSTEERMKLAFLPNTSTII